MSDAVNMQDEIEQGRVYSFSGKSALSFITLHV